MLNISKPLSSGQAQAYHKLEFTSETANYYKQDGAVEGQWQGQLAGKMGLSGTVTAEEFALLTEGRHPQTDEQMVKHREAHEYKNADGSTTKAVEHRAGWDATFSPPKSVSVTALVGGDDRVRQAHGEAVIAAVNALEQYAQARIGGNNPAETTGKFIAAKFEHDTARPVDGYAAPQLHTHVLIFNVTERADGSTRALQERALFESQAYATAVYQSVLAYRLRSVGYEIEQGRSGAPEIKGYSQEYLDASSPRSQQIKDHLEKTGRRRRRSRRTRPVTASRFLHPSRYSRLTARSRSPSATRPPPSLPRPATAPRSRPCTFRRRKSRPPKPGTRSRTPAAPTSSVRRPSMSGLSCAMPYGTEWASRPSTRCGLSLTPASRQAIL